MNRFRDYDPFAWLYANHWGDEFHAAVQAPLRRAVLGELPRNAKVLDLCCGDGRLAAALIRQGFEVTGIDGSSEMLAYARQRCPKARFLLADARAFELPAEFHAAISTFDSLNHVMTGAGLSQVFRRVWDCLRPGGTFVFDLNREEAYRESWVNTGHTVTGDVVSVSRGEYLPQRRIAVCDVTLMRKRSGIWERSDFQLRQKCHRQETVLAKLAKAGFRASVEDAVKLGMDDEIGAGRDFYIAQKPKKRG